MKVYESEDKIFIILNYVSNDLNFEDKNVINKFVKQIFFKLKSYYHLNVNGFYKVKIYPNKLGLFIEMLKIDDDIYDPGEVDFRVIIIYNKDIYFEYDDYSLIKNKNVFFYNGKYFIDIKYIDNYIRYCDYGSIVLLDDIDLNRCIYIYDNN